ncbi:hypothetical protein HMPREF0005_02141 [Achromobacter xylosoxidans C54]|nr:hypothetical protein HMPREF0005_02141 [Achromobacter xylosoxidans C54]
MKSVRPRTEAGAPSSLSKESTMPETDWYPGSTLPDRQGYFEVAFDTGETEITRYGILGWEPAEERGRILRWRGLDPKIEAAEIERESAVRNHGDDILR